MWQLITPSASTPHRLPPISIQLMVLLFFVLITIGLLLQKFLSIVFLIRAPIKSQKPKRALLEYSFYYHLAIIILLLAREIHWNGFDLVLWVASYVGVGMLRKTLLIIAEHRDHQLNDFVLDPQIKRFMQCAIVYAAVLLGISLTYFYIVHYMFMGISLKLIFILLFPTFMLMVDSFFLIANNICILRQLQYYFNPNSDSLPSKPLYQLLHTILSSAIRSWYYYNILRLFFKSFFSQLQFFDSLWMLTIMNQGYNSVITLGDSIKKYKGYKKLISKINRIFIKQEPQQQQPYQPNQQDQPRQQSHQNQSNQPHPPPNQQLRTCIVCLQDLKKCRKLIGCGHTFHYRCLFQWLLTKSQCPICRVRINLNIDGMPLN